MDMIVVAKSCKILSWYAVVY